MANANGNGNNVNNGNNGSGKPDVVVKVPFSLAHPKITKAVKTGLKVLAGIGTVFGAAYAANVISDSKRTYYQITVEPPVEPGSETDVTIYSDESITEPGIGIETTE